MIVPTALNYSPNIDSIDRASWGGEGKKQNFAEIPTALTPHPWPWHVSKAKPEEKAVAERPQPLPLNKIKVGGGQAKIGGGERDRYLLLCSGSAMLCQGHLLSL